MKNLLRKIFKPRIQYESLIEVRIFKQAILHNLREFQKTYPKLKFAPVLKSNAYGHGLVQVAEILDNQNAAFFTVDSFYEALVLRREGIKTKIVILDYAREQQILNNKLKDCSFGVVDLQQLKSLVVKLNRPQALHLKIDTGMHRQGILMGQINEAIGLIKQNPNFILEGVCTHLADADGQDKQFTEQQIEHWNTAAAIFKKQFPEIKYFHASNTAGTFFSGQIDANVSRLGIGLFGFNQSPFQKLNLEPALEMRSIITTIKTIPSGGKVGYNVIYTAPAETKIATIPVGYYEGLDRRLSDKGFVKIQNQFCPLVGRVSMNMSSVDVSAIEHLQLGDEVIVISNNPEDKNSLNNMAQLSGAVVYELCVHIPQHLRRVVV